jgi:uncharacterized protein YggE
MSKHHQKRRGGVIKMGGFRQFMFGAAVAAAIVSVFALARSGGAGDGLTSQAQAASTASVQQLSPFLRFSGTGTVQVKPDTASLSFNTNGQSSDKATAVNAASAAMRHVIAAMTHHGISHKDLQTSTDVYHDTTRGVYVASESLQVTVRNIKSAGKLVADGLNAGADNSSGPYFSLTDQNTGYDAALRDAVTNARAHADAAAALIGAQVTGVISVDDTTGQSAEPYYYGKVMFAAAGDAVGPMPVEHGTQPVSATVTVVFSYATD